MKCCKEKLMIISKTKYNATDAEIKELFSFHKIGNVTDITALGCGEFNAAYKVTCGNGNSYALKIAPPESAKVLIYENQKCSGIRRCMKKQTSSVLKFLFLIFQNK